MSDTKIIEILFDNFLLYHYYILINDYHNYWMLLMIYMSINC